MMIMKKRIAPLFTCIALLAIFGASCSGRVEEAGPTAQVETAGTITFTEKDTQKGILRGTYEYEGYTIKFEAIRGEKNPIFSRLTSADSPEYAVDARFCDMQGFCFANAAGGHAFANSDWIKEDRKTIPDDERLTKNAITLSAFHEDLKQLPPSEKAGLLEEFDVLRILSDAPRYDTSQFKQSRSEGTPAKGVFTIRS